MPAKILIVDDDAVWRMMAHRILKAENYEPLIATDALTALSETQRHKPDLILLDLGLPAGGGRVFLSRLRTFPALTVIPVIVISGQERMQGQAVADTGGAVAYLQKPVAKEDLLSAVRKVLG